MLGLNMLLASARRTSVRGRTARRGLAQSRRETAAASQERDKLIDQRQSTQGDAVQNTEPAPRQDSGHRGRHLFGH